MSKRIKIFLEKLKFVIFYQRFLSKIPPAQAQVAVILPVLMAK